MIVPVVVSVPPLIHDTPPFSARRLSSRRVLGRAAQRAVLVLESPGGRHRSGPGAELSTSPVAVLAAFCRSTPRPGRSSEGRIIGVAVPDAVIDVRRLTGCDVLVVPLKVVVGRRFGPSLVTSAL